MSAKNKEARQHKNLGKIIYEYLLVQMEI